MTVRNTRTIGVLAATFALFGAGLAQAQTIIIQGGTARENIQASAVLQRAPGTLVNAGLARVQAFRSATAGGIEITQTAPQTSVRAQALADSIRILFEGLNQALTLLQDAVLVRGGRSPSGAIGGLLDSVGGLPGTTPAGGTTATGGTTGTGTTPTTDGTGGGSRDDRGGAIPDRSGGGRSPRKSAAGTDD